MHRVGKIVYVKVNLHLIDASDLTAKDWSDMLEFLAEQEATNPAAENDSVCEVDQTESVLDEMDMETALDLEQVYQWNAVDLGE